MALSSVGYGSGATQSVLRCKFQSKIESARFGDLIVGSPGVSIRSVMCSLLIIMTRVHPRSQLCTESASIYLLG